MLSSGCFQTSFARSLSDGGPIFPTCFIASKTLNAHEGNESSNIQFHLNIKEGHWDELGLLSTTEAEAEFLSFPMGSWKSLSPPALHSPRKIALHTSLIYLLLSTPKHPSWLAQSIQESELRKTSAPFKAKHVSKCPTAGLSFQLAQHRQCSTTDQQRSRNTDNTTEGPHLV